MCDDPQHVFARSGEKLRVVAPFALPVITPGDLIVEDPELRRPLISECERPMQRVHRDRDSYGDYDEGDDLEAFDAVDGERPARREEVEVDEKEGQRSGDGAWPSPAVPGGERDCRNEKKKARGRSVSPKREIRRERNGRGGHRQRVSRCG